MKIGCQGNHVYCDGGFELHLNHFSESGLRSLPLQRLGLKTDGSHTALLEVDSAVIGGQILLHLGVPPLNKAGPSGLIGATIRADGRNIIDGNVDSKRCFLVKGGEQATIILPLSRIKALRQDYASDDHVDLSVEYSRLRDISAINGAPQIDPTYIASDSGIGITGINGAGLSKLESPPPYQIHLRLRLDSGEHLITEVVRRVIDKLEAK